MMHLDALFALLQPGLRQIVAGRRAVSGCFAYLSALCLEDSTFLFIDSSDARQREAISAYINRPLAETLLAAASKVGGSI